MELKWKHNKYEHTERKDRKRLKQRVCDDMKILMVYKPAPTWLSGNAFPNINLQISKFTAMN